MTTLRPLIAALCLACATSALAQNMAPPSDRTQLPALSPAERKLSANYVEFSGSPQNAEALVYGLRTGSSVTLVDPVSGQASTLATPAKPMGVGNVRIALNLARAQLAAQGITNPTTSQLQGALTGSQWVAADGTVTTQQGILQMRASGMGWGEIAQANGVKLGSVMSGKTPASNPALAGTSSAAGNGRSSGVTTGAGVGGNAYGQSGRSGATTAAGIGQGGGHAYGRNNANGAVTAAGAAAGAAASSNAGGSGAGHAYGRGGKP